MLAIFGHRHNTISMSENGENGWVTAIWVGEVNRASGHLCSRRGTAPGPPARRFRVLGW